MWTYQLRVFVMASWHPMHEGHENIYHGFLFPYFYLCSVFLSFSSVAIESLSYMYLSRRNILLRFNFGVD